MNGQGSDDVSFRETTDILAIVDRIALHRGTTRSAIYREAIRYWLADKSHLTEEQKKDILGSPKHPTHG